MHVFLHDLLLQQGSEHVQIYFQIVSHVMDGEDDEAWEPQSSLLDNFLRLHQTPGSTAPPASNVRDQVALSQTLLPSAGPLSSRSQPAGAADLGQRSAVVRETRTPRQIVQEAWASVGREASQPHSSGIRTPARQQLWSDTEVEADDVNLQDPVAALSTMSLLSLLSSCSFSNSSFAIVCMKVCLRKYKIAECYAFV